MIGNLCAPTAINIHEMASFLKSNPRCGVWKGLSQKNHLTENATANSDEHGDLNGHLWRFV